MSKPENESKYDLSASTYKPTSRKRTYGPQTYGKKRVEEKEIVPVSVKSEDIPEEKIVPRIAPKIIPKITTETQVFKPIVIKQDAKVFKKRELTEEEQLEEQIRVLRNKLINLRRTKKYADLMTDFRRKEREERDEKALKKKPSKKDENENSLELISEKKIYDLNKYYEPVYSNISLEFRERNLDEEEKELDEKYKNILEEYEPKRENSVFEETGEMFIYEEFIIQRNKELMKGIEVAEGTQLRELQDQIIKQLYDNTYMNFMLPVKLIGGLREIEHLNGVFIGAAYELSNGAFFGCPNLREVYLPITLTSIPSFCFSNCENLYKIRGGEYIQIIYDFAFYNCKKLFVVNFPKTRYIGNHAFEKCENLNKIAFILDKIDYVGKNAFKETKVKRLIGMKNYVPIKGCAMIIREGRTPENADNIENPTEVLFVHNKEIIRPSEQECRILEKKLKIYEVRVERGELPEFVREDLFKLEREDEKENATWINKSNKIASGVGKREKLIEEWIGEMANNLLELPDIEKEEKKIEHSTFTEDMYNILITDEEIARIKQERETNKSYFESPFKEEIKKDEMTFEERIRNIERIYEESTTEDSSEELIKF